MGIIERFFPAKTTITSQAIRAEITSSENEIIAQRAKLGSALAGVAAMSDAEHVKAEGEIASIERAITRLDARIAHLNAELPVVIASEEAAAKASADAALRQRAKAAEKAAGIEARKLLESYNERAAAIADILNRLNEIQKETDSVNQALRVNPITESVSGYEANHRKHPDREASEQRETRPCWVYPDGTVREATSFDDKGQPVMPAISFDRATGVRDVPRLEQREIVVSRTSHRHGAYLHGLNDVRLPPGTLDSEWHWPRQS